MLSGQLPCGLKFVSKKKKRNGYILVYICGRKKFSPYEQVQKKKQQQLQMIANKVQSLIIKLAAPINKIRGILRKLDSKLRR